MDELIRTNDPVLISLVTAMLGESGITHLLLDQHMSILEGSLGILQKRILVATDELEAARGLLRDAGLGQELSGSDGTS